MGIVDDFRSRFPQETEKIERDPALPDAVRNLFWICIGNYDASIELSDHAQNCCRNWPLHGPTVALGADECLGTAQPRIGLIDDLTVPLTLDPARIPPLRHEVERSLDEICSLVDVDEAVAAFRRNFENFRIRSHRIFAFRNPADPVKPLNAAPLPETFNRLAIPGAHPNDYLLLAYEPENRINGVRQPTALDAGAKFESLSSYEPGGVTRPVSGVPGLPEVVSDPPLAQDVVIAPRKIA